MEANFLTQTSVNVEDERDVRLIPGLRRSPGGGRGNRLQYFCQETSQTKESLAGYSPRGLKESDMTEYVLVPPGTKRAPFMQEFYLLLSG